MLEKILVCLDGSKEAEQILPFIISDKQFSHSMITLFRVISLPELTIPISVPGTPGVPMNTEATIKQMQAKENDAATYLQKTADSLCQQGLKVDHAYIPGIAGEAIVEYAMQNDFTLIAIATHGHGAARRFFVGSTADFVTHHSPLPVLLIRPK